MSDAAIVSAPETIPTMDSHDVLPAVVPAPMVQAKSKKTKAVPKKDDAPSKTKVKSHPSYLEMIVEAVKKLQEPTGSSRQAINKYLKETYQIDDKKNKNFINKTLTKAVSSGALKQIKGSYKVVEKVKPEKKKTTSKKNVGEEKTTKSTKPKTAKSVEEKKATPKKDISKKVATTSKSPIAAAKTTKAPIKSPKATAKSTKTVGKKAAPAKVKIPTPKKTAAPRTAASPKEKTVKTKKPAVSKKATAAR